MEIEKINHGRILTEFPQLCIDNFQCTSEMDSTTFFVTHYDSDTLCKILLASFLEELGDTSKSHCLYMHRIVFSLLNYWTTTTYLYQNEDMDADEVVDKLEQLLQNGKIRFLEVNIPVKLQLESSNSSSTVVQLTPLPSGSLAGCVMLLIETNDTRILYTGACRLTLKDLHSCQPLHNSDGSVKKIDKIYLDTTFCLEDVKELPSRSRTVKELAKIITKQIQLDDQKQFEFQELELNNLFCLRQLAEVTGQKIHVPFELTEFLLEGINPSFSKFVTNEADKMTHIHYDCVLSCDHEDCSPNGNIDFVATPIKFSCTLKSLFGNGMIGINQPSIDQIHIQKGNVVYCTPWAKTETLSGIYSNHLSLNEMGRMLNYLHVKPSNVLPLFLMTDMITDDIELGLEFACDTLDEPTEIAEELPAHYFDLTMDAESVFA